jgi:hypothetical protein
MHLPSVLEAMRREFPFGVYNSAGSMTLFPGGWQKSNETVSGNVPFGLEMRKGNEHENKETTPIHLLVGPKRLWLRALPNALQRREY